jgi:dihydroorotase
MSEQDRLVLRDCVVFGTHQLVDIAVAAGAIEAIGPGLSCGGPDLDCAGALVSPAWVDSHIHVRSEATPGRIDPLTYGPAQGVGAVIDAGSAPPARLSELLQTAPWVYALANIDSRGIRGDGGASAEISGGAAGEALSNHAGRVVGIKVQASQSVLGELALKAISNAVRVAERHRAPVMVHVGNPPPLLEAVCDALRPGDVITHYAHGKPEGATLADGSVLPALRRACERGVLLDVGHGRSSFSFRRCRRLLDAGIRPSSISTDLHAVSAEAPVVSLARTMSKLVALGLSETEVIEAVTATPARTFALAGYGGAVEARAPARLTVFRIEDREVETEDSAGERMVCRRWFQPQGCLLDGTWHPAATPV